MTRSIPDKIAVAYFLFAYAVLLFLPTALAAQNLDLWGGLEPGPHSVGYRVQYEIDHSRVWDLSADLRRPEGSGRPIRLSIWYPAETTDRPSLMAFGEYVYYDAPTLLFAQLRDHLESRLRWVFSEASPELYDTLLTIETATMLDAPAAAGRFPLVLYASGGRASIPDNGALASFLASYGYVVVAIPQLGPTSDDELRRDPIDQVETQARDLEFAMGHAIHFPEVNPHRVAVMGYSFGGSVALEVASRNPRVSALVGLDPSYASGRGGAIDIKSVRVPILSLHADREEGWAARSNRILDSLHYSTRHIGTVPEMVHADFSELRGMQLPVGLPELLDEEELAVAHRGYKAVCIEVLNFLDEVLEGRSSTAIDRPSQSTLPAIDITIKERVPIPTEEEFVQIIEGSGFDEARSLLEVAERQYPYIDAVDERLMNQFGYGLLNRNRVALAVDVFRLNTVAHPTSANAFDSMANGCLALGDTVQTVRALEHVLELLPSDSALSDSRKDRMRRNASLMLRLLEP